MVVVNPRVSIVLPVWNGARYLEGTLSSLRSQTMGDYELIIIDDGSDDGTSAILSKGAQVDHRIKLITNRRRSGMGFVFNQGIGLATADYVARMDGDDIAHPERLARQLDFLEANSGVVIVGSQIQLIDSLGALLGIRRYPLSDIDLRRAMARYSPFAHPATMYRRRAVLDLGGYDSRWAPAEDLDLWIRLSRVGELANLPDTLLSYRLHGESVTSRQGLRMQAQSARVRINGVKRHGLRMSFFDVVLATAQLFAAPLPYSKRMELFAFYRRLLG